MKFIVDAQLPKSLADFLREKDFADFYNSFTAKKEPYKLLHIKTGNIRNSELIEIFEKNISLIVQELANSSVVQLSQNHIIKIH